MNIQLTRSRALTRALKQFMLLMLFATASLITTAVAAPEAHASHTRGGTIFYEIDETGRIDAIVELQWDVQVAGGVILQLPAGVTQVSNTMVSFQPIGTAYDTHAVQRNRFILQVTDPSLYSAANPLVGNLRWSTCCWIAGIPNVGGTAAELLSGIRWEGPGTRSASPRLDGQTLTLVPDHPDPTQQVDFVAALNATHPYGEGLSYEFIVGGFGPAYAIPGITIDATTGVVTIPAEEVANLQRNTAGESLSDMFYKVRVTSASGTFTERDVIIGIADTENLPPVIDAGGNRSVQVGQTLSVQITGTDPNGDLVRLSAVSLPEGATFTSSSTPEAAPTGTFTFTPTEDQVGEVIQVQFIAQDDGVPILAGTAQISLTVLGNNLPPRLGFIGNQTLFDVVAGDTLSFPITATDPNPQDTLTYSYEFYRENQALDGSVPIALTPQTGNSTTVSWTPTPADVGVHRLRLRVDDSGDPSLFDAQDIFISVGAVNQSPALDTLPARVTVMEGELIQLFVRAVDPQEDDVVTLSVPNPPTGSTLTPIVDSLNIAESLFEWTPQAGEAGTYTLRFRATDNGSPSLSETRSVEVVVIAPQGAPVITSISPSRARKDAQATITIAGGNFLGTVSVMLEAFAEGAAERECINVVVNGAGTSLTCELPDASDVISDDFTVDLRLTSERLDGGITDTQEVLRGEGFRFVGNSAPVANNQTVSTSENSARSFSLSVSDADNDALSFTLDSAPANGTLSFSEATQSATYTPNPGFFGIDSFDYVANDGEADSAVATVIVNVAKITLPPVALAGSGSVFDGDTLDIELDAQDREVADLSELVFELVDAPAHGTLSIVIGNQVTYSPNAGYFGADSFTFKVLNPVTGLESQPAEYTIEVIERADLALSLAMSGYADQDGSGSITRGDILAFAATLSHEGGGAINDAVFANAPSVAPSADSCTGQPLAAGDSCEISWDYEVTLADVAAGQIVAEAQVTSSFAQAPAVDEVIVAIETLLSLNPVDPTNADAPTFSGQVSLPAGSEVDVVITDSTGQRHELTATVDDAEGFVFTPGLMLPEGSYYVEISYTNDGGERVSEGAFGVIDRTAPALVVIGPEGPINTNQPRVYGTSEPGALITLNTPEGSVQVVADGSGRWSWEPSAPLADDDYSVDVTATDAAGNSSSESTDFRVLTAELLATIEAPAAGDVLSDADVTFSGTANPNTTVELFVDGESVGQALIDESGEWSFPSDGPLEDGQHQAYVVVSDDAGNTFRSPVRRFRVDTVTPEGAITNPVAGNVSDEVRPTIEGYASAGSEVEVFLDGSSIGTVTADDTGRWSLELGEGLIDGEYTVGATVRDDAGNLSELDDISFVVDTQAPFVAITAPAEDAVMVISPEAFEGQAEADAQVSLYINGALVGTTTADAQGRWSWELEGTMPLGQFELRATATDEAGNGSEATQSFTIVDGVYIASPQEDALIRNALPSFSGLGEPGDTVEISSDDEVLGSALVDENGIWEWTASEPFEDGEHTVVVSGSGDSSDDVSFTIDTVLTGVAIASPAPSELIASPTPTFTGSAPPNSEVTFYVDGEAVDTVSADSNGSWEWTPEENLQDGTRQIEAEAINEAGDPTSAEISVDIDTRPPILAVSAPSEVDSVQPGWEVTGNAEPGAVVVVTLNGEELGTTTVGEDGTWSLPGDDELEIGEYELRATATDEAGNTSFEEQNVVVGESMDRLGASLAGGGCSTSGQGQGGSPVWMVLMLLGMVGLRRRRQAALAKAATMVAAGGVAMGAVALSATPAQAQEEAQGFDIQHFSPMPGLDTNLFSTSGASVAPHMGFSALAAINTASNPLVLVDENGDRLRSIVEHQTTTHLLFSLGLFDRAEIGVDLPVVVFQNGAALPGQPGLSGDAGMGLGDMRLVPKLNLLNTRSHGFDTGVALAVLVDAYLPTGQSSAFQGGAFRVGPRLAFDARVTPDLLLAINAGYRFQSASDVENLSIDDRVALNAGAEYSITDALRLTGEVFGSVTPFASELFGRESNMEFMAGGKYRFDQLFVAAGAGAGLTEGYGTPSWRALLSFGYSTAAPAAAPRPAPQPEIAPECEGASECTELPASSCQGGTLTTYGASCNAGSCDYQPTMSYCSDAEICGEVDGEPACVEAPECTSDSECSELPEASCTDGVLVTYGGACDGGECTYAASELSCAPDQVCGEANGQPACITEVARVTVDEEENRIELNEAVHFETGSATISADSFSLLDEVATILTDNPSILRVEISGHTDDRGQRSTNVELSRERANSVMAYLVEKGIDAGRLSAVGKGPNEPIADNSTEEGRAENRRVELKILEREL